MTKRRLSENDCDRKKYAEDKSPSKFYLAVNFILKPPRHSSVFRNSVDECQRKFIIECCRPKPSVSTRRSPDFQPGRSRSPLAIALVIRFASNDFS